MKWISMTVNSGIYRVCKDDSGYLWLVEDDVVSNCNILGYDKICNSLIDLYCVEPWAYEKSPRQEKMFADGSNIMCLYDDYVWWLTKRFGRFDVSVVIEKYLEENVDKIERGDQNK